MLHSEESTILSSFTDKKAPFLLVYSRVESRFKINFSTLSSLIDTPFASTLDLNNDMAGALKKYCKSSVSNVKEASLQ